MRAENSASCKDTWLDVALSDFEALVTSEDSATSHGAVSTATVTHGGGEGLSLLEERSQTFLLSHPLALDPLISMAHGSTHRLC